MSPRKAGALRDGDAENLREHGIEPSGRP